MSFVHDGTNIPTAPPLAPGEVDWYGVAWDDVAGVAALEATPVWSVTDGLSVDDQVDDEPQTVDVGLPGERAWQRVNKVQLSGGEAGACHLVSNTIRVGGRTLTRSFRLPVEAL